MGKLAYKVCRASTDDIPKGLRAITLPKAKPLGETAAAAAAGREGESGPTRVARVSSRREEEGGAFSLRVLWAGGGEQGEGCANYLSATIFPRLRILSASVASSIG
ncbi:unnamed protein product, partial [Amoebophrya sp. A120]|eukprot:GSA120T00016046001.1